MKVCIVEDQGYKALYPLTKTRPVFGLRCGRFTLEERILKVLAPHTQTVHYLMRPELEQVWKLKNKAVTGISFGIPGDGDRLIINGRVLFRDVALEKLLAKAEQTESMIWLVDDTWGAVYLPGNFGAVPDNALIDGKFDTGLFSKQGYLDLKVIKYPWDLVTHNSAMIREDFSFLSSRLNRLRYPPLPKQVAIMGGKSLIIGKYSEIYPFITFDTTLGPVIVGDNVTIESGAFIKGPVSIGNNCLISANTKLYPNTTLGDTCKLGGEISHSIIHGFSNKHHSGFLGNSYIGEWVNLGAGTNNSNLKNNYNTITVHLNGEQVETGSQFIGLFMGDHSRTAIGARFNTATFVGVGCNIFGAGLPPKYVDDFTWGGIEQADLFDFQKFLENAKRMLIRREVELSDAEIKLLKSLHEYRTVIKTQEKVANNGNSESAGKR